MGIISFLNQEWKSILLQITIFGKVGDKYYKKTKLKDKQI